MSTITAETNRLSPRLHRVVEHFGPQWFGSTMGTGALGIALALVADTTGVGAAMLAGRALVVFTALLTTAFTIPWLARTVVHPDRVLADLHHPIRSQFFPTMPITLIVLGVGIARTMGPQLGAALQPVLTLLFVVGSAGIVGFGLLLTVVLFSNDETSVEHGVFALYIPPVSHLVIPLLGFLLVEQFYAGTAVGRAFFAISVMAIGVGTFMFLFVGSIVLYRYAYESLPPEKLAPTFVIGLAPTAVLVVAIGRLVGALEAGVGLGIAVETVVPMVKLLALGLWGFTAWWFVLTLSLVGYYLRTREHPFFFTWWAYTFPTAAFAISAGAMGHLFAVPAFEAVLVGVTALLTVVWVLTAGLTGRMIARGQAFRPK